MKAASDAEIEEIWRAIGDDFIPVWMQMREKISAAGWPYVSDDTHIYVEASRAMIRHITSTPGGRRALTVLRSGQPFPARDIAQIFHGYCRPGGENPARDKRGAECAEAKELRRELRKTGSRIFPFDVNAPRLGQAIAWLWPYGLWRCGPTAGAAIVSRYLHPKNPVQRGVYHRELKRLRLTPHAPLLGGDEVSAACDDVGAWVKKVRNCP